MAKTWPTARAGESLATVTRRRNSPHAGITAIRTYCEVAEILGVSMQAVQQAEARAMKKMRAHFGVDELGKEL